MFGAGDTDTITARATVKSVDMTTRMVTLVGPRRTVTMKAGEQAQNLAQVKPGDIVVVHYYDSVATPPPPGTAAGRRRGDGRSAGGAGDVRLAG